MGLETNNIVVDDLILNGLTADPTTPSNGCIWYRSDLNKFFKRVDGTTVDLTVGEWKPPTLPLGDLSTSGSTFFTNSGAGIYLSMDGASDDKFFFNCALMGANGVAYDGSDIKIKIHGRKGSAGSGTVGLIVDYAIMKDGDNSYTSSTNIAQQDTTVTSWNEKEENDITLGTMTGVVGGHVLQVTVTRNSTGAGEDSYSGDFEITALEIIKA